MFLMRKLGRKIPLGRPGHRFDYSGSGKRHVVGEHSNEHSGSIK